MKNISYLDMIKELLPESEFLKFQECYNNPIKKSVKIISHRWLNNDIDIYNIVKSTLSKERNLLEPKFSYNWNKYNDALFAIRKENLKPSSLWSHYLHQAWLIYVQEMAASLSVQMLWLTPSDIVLDMCAAPWWKSIQIADKLTNWFLISNEIDSWRKKALESNLHRCWIYNVWIIQEDWCVIWDKLPETFDKVLVDAPCSWEWMQYKSDQKVWQWNEKKSRDLSNLQTKLLISWLKALKLWGELVYSTCTTNVLENEWVVSEVLKQYWDRIELLEIHLDEKSPGISNWRWEKILSSENVNKVARLWPHIHETWWFFIAKFRKINHIWDNNEKQNLLKKEGNQFTDEEVWSKLGERWIKRDERVSFFISDYTVNAVSDSPLLQELRYKKPKINLWLPIFKIVKDSKNNSSKLISLSWISQIFWHLAINNVIDINDNQLKDIMEKKDLIDERLHKYKNKHVILLRNWVWVWLISVQNNIWKNKCF